ncbi:MAG: hypothetical protein IVW53_15585, partial [Chloroflexi bacterium]|nr:hypothetical protein [Chloroflexota bacterium]
MRIEHPLEDGATDDQWRALIRGTGVRIKNDTKPWGPMARRDFLNFLEEKYPNRMPQFFESKQEALQLLEENRKEISISNEES